MWFNNQDFPDNVILPDRLVNFLTERFDQDFSMSYINSFRSAVSATAPPWNSVPLGQCELVVRCMNKMECMRPSDPAYEQSWDLNLLLHWLETLEDNELLDTLTL